jgi:UDP-N-acetylglucosamine 4,6-dehydratase
VKRMQKNSIVTITGGTGSFGQTLTKSLLKDDISEIRIFSRDENKQEIMRNYFRDERLRFFLGDVRDKSSVTGVIKRSNYVFHAAALKQVPSCEFFPMQAVATNVLGSSNVLEASIENGVESVVCLSTDKAVYPINAMGMTKALMEKISQSYVRSSEKTGTRISVTRYGNVMLSRGSVIPLFINQILESKSVSVTNLKMTRFFMSLEESVNLVKYAFAEGTSGDIFVRKAPGATIATLVKALEEILGCPGLKVNKIGIRHGEKLHESLLSAEEMLSALDCGEYYRVPLDTRTLNYQVYFDEGKPLAEIGDGYTSSNTNQLTVEELISKLLNTKDFRELARI